MTALSPRVRISTGDPSYYSRDRLSSLHIELLYMIADFLLPQDEASLSICSHHLYNIFGCFPFPCRQTASRNIFLQRMARDLPEYVYCTSCYCLHSKNTLGPPGPLNQPSILWNKHGILDYDHSWALRRTTVAFSAAYRFRGIHLHLALKRYHCGPAHGVSTKWLSYIQVNRDPATPGTKLFSADVQILPKLHRVCLRIQTWFLANPNNLYYMWTIPFPLCDHLFVPDFDDIRYCMQDNRQAGCLPDKYPHPEFYRCPHCKMKFEIRLVSCGNDGDAFVITRYLNLGSGGVHQEYKWQRHVGGSVLSTYDNFTLQPQGWGEMILEHESSNGLSYQDLTHRNGRLLYQRAYEREMDQLLEGEWVLQQDERLPQDLRAALPIRRR
ncbi:uncharacterized protein BO72DRAFT_517480 [Aspergillus fijiensis CBS 313.89]|uniref:F-box domain-containing protein n=1 Tax=Aspergillus fijiensis CBS 313.89 TaxID=1448319 RepID=A0A8G1RJ51_9EURO|nr:uncharacterized protein BO72DRAFT_517480 [Aspergillus fijiensis CBS 313.89]RAK73769.1 hypothetical protein BO72DRAFT_517480 [Aspergillus fijiensis CBS 313.89]